MTDNDRSEQEKYIFTTVQDLLCLDLGGFILWQWMFQQSKVNDQESEVA